MKTTVKNELTIDNMINLLNQQNYTVNQLTTNNMSDTDRFKLQDFNNVAITMINCSQIYHYNLRARFVNKLAPFKTPHG